nr:tetratricopeptide repeat protein [Gemmatimonadota bacterium]
GTSSHEAYNLYLQGRFFWNKRTPEGLARGMVLFQEALERDPSFAPAHAGLADSYALLVTFGALPPAEGYPRTQAAAERALALDSTLAEAHASLALVKLYYERNWVGADRQFRRAIELSPGYATARHWYANFLAYRGNPEAARAQMQRALELDPLSVAIQTAAGTLFYYERQYDQAAAQYRKALEMDPTFWPALLQLGSAHLQQGLHREAITEVEEATRLSGDHPLPLAFLGYSYAVSGRREEARHILSTLKAEARTRYISPVYLAGIHAALAENDDAFEWLDRGLESRDDWMIYLRADPVFDPLRSDPRFPQLLATVGAAR